jgi:hypothetical protein
VEDAISSPVDIPSAIKRYQDVLQYASSKVDFVFGGGLYMAPSDMKLKIGNIKGYNNNIIIATAEQILGLNTLINNTPHVTQPTPHVPQPTPHIQSLHIDVTDTPHLPHNTPQSLPKHIIETNQQHITYKTWLITGGIVISVWLMSRH